MIEGDGIIQEMYKLGMTVEEIAEKEGLTKKKSQGYPEHRACRKTKAGMDRVVHSGVDRNGKEAAP